MWQLSQLRTHAAAGNGKGFAGGKHDYAEPSGTAQLLLNRDAMAPETAPQRARPRLAQELPETTRTCPLCGTQMHTRARPGDATPPGQEWICHTCGVIEEADPSVTEGVK